MRTRAWNRPMPASPAESRDPFESLRRQGADDLGHPRRGPGDLLPVLRSLVGPPVPDEPYTVPIGEAAVRNEGKDITLVGYAPQTVELAKAVELLKQDGISAELIDPRTLAPLEGVMPTILQSVAEDRPAPHLRRRLLQFLELHGDRGPRGRGPAGTKVKRLAFPDARPRAPRKCSATCGSMRPRSPRPQGNWSRDEGAASFTRTCSLARTSWPKATQRYLPEFTSCAFIALARNGP